MEDDIFKRRQENEVGLMLLYNRFALSLLKMSTFSTKRAFSHFLLNSLPYQIRFRQRQKANKRRQKMSRPAWTPGGQFAPVVCIAMLFFASY